MTSAKGGLSDELLQVLVDLAVAMTEDPPVAALLDLLAAEAAAVFPVDGVGVSVSGLSPPLTTATDALSLEAERSQAGSGEGPGWLCRATSAAVSVPDLLADDRFPQFQSYAAAAGVRGVFSFPLQHGETRLGVLSLYRAAAGGLSPAECTAAQTLARVAAAYLVNIQRRIELQQVSDLSRHLALHDTLTGLPNRALMMERLEHAFERNRRTGRVAAVLYLDIDGFKAVNDTLGHAAGDELLIAVTTRITSLLRPPDTLARLHGDEFVLLCEDFTDPGQAAQICRRLQDALDQPLTVNHAQVVVQASVGVVITDADTTDPAAVLRDADTAMYEAKRRGGAQFWMHNPTTHPDK